MTPTTRNGYRAWLNRLPSKLERLGFRPPPTCARDYTPEMVEAYAHADFIAPTTRQVVLSVLRHFLKDAGSPVADDDATWKAPKAVARRRRWLDTPAELAALIRATPERSRIAVVLAACAGMRQKEIRTLRVESLRLSMDGRSVAWVTGKGDKLREVRLLPLVRNALMAASHGKSPTALVYPLSASCLAVDLAEGCERAGLAHVSPHDLRRTYGRFARRSGAPIEVIQAQYGHADSGMTTYYIGEDPETMDRATEALEAYLDAVR